MASQKPTCIQGGTSLRDPYTCRSASRLQNRGNEVDLDTGIGVRWTRIRVTRIRPVFAGQRMNPGVDRPLMRPMLQKRPQSISKIDTSLRSGGRHSRHPTRTLLAALRGILVPASLRSLLALSTSLWGRLSGAPALRAAGHIATAAQLARARPRVESAGRVTRIAARSGTHANLAASASICRLTCCFTRANQCLNLKCVALLCGGDSRKCDTV